VELLLLVPAVLQQLDWANEDGLTPAALALKHGHKLMQGMLLQAADAAAAGRPASSGAALDNKVAGTTVEGLGVGMASGAAAVGSVGPSRSMQAALSQQPVLQGLRPGFLLPHAARLQQVLSSSDEEDDASPGSGSSSPWSRVGTDAVLTDRVGGDSAISGPQGAAAAVAEQTLMQQEMSAAGDAGTSSRQQPAANRADSSSNGGNAGAAAGIDRQLGRSWLDAARAGELRLLKAMAAAHPQLITYCGLGTSYALIGNSVSKSHVLGQ
jgi:hypothetical protein